ncbi:hypothetical protein FOZ60_011374 [Perkinsus olseni]|uniref:RING-type domain-containing protein n=1 Tax=Perkinsus olseni TaxID=32597 RepID=A0A7J6NDC8_PEROL|nr:hypothetical protein FOZ60_011374 [Perkinsus olseni]
MNLAALMSRRFMVVWVAWVVLAVAYTVWIFESPDSQGASSPLMIVLMCILIAVPIVALFVGSRMVKKLFPPPPPRGTYRRDSVIDLEDGRGRFPTMDSVMESATSQSFFKAWDYWVQDNTTTATIDDISHDDAGADDHRDEESCAICLSEYQVGEVSRRLPCVSSRQRTHTNSPTMRSCVALLETLKFVFISPVTWSESLVYLCCPPSSLSLCFLMDTLKALVRRETYAPALERRFRFIWLLYLIIYVVIAAVLIIMVQFDYIFFIYCTVAAVIPPLLIIRYCYKIEKREEDEDRAIIQAHLDGTDEAGIRRRCRAWLRHSCRKVDGSEPTLTGRVCPICLGDFSVGDRVWILPCLHAYHVQCLDIMLKESKPEQGRIFRCPICRVQLGMEDEHLAAAVASDGPIRSFIISGENSVVVPPTPTAPVEQKWRGSMQFGHPIYDSRTPGQGYVFLVYVILCGVVPPLLIMQYAHNVKAREERRQLESLNRRPSRSKVDVDDKEIAALHREWDEWLKEKCEDIHGSDLTGDEEPCAICLVDYTSDDEVVRLPCGHEYHTDCIRLMFDSFPRNGTLYHRCPLCRVEIGRLEQASSESPHDSVDVSPPSPVSS